MKHIFFVLFTNLLANGCWSQSDSFTNVDTNYLKPKWIKRPISLTTYRNGKEILRVQNPFEFAKTNKPAYFIKQVKGVEQFYYNQRVLLMNQGDTLAPKGYKVASPQDFSKLFLYKTTLNGKNYVLNLDDLFIEFNGYLDEGFWENEPEYFIWTPIFVDGSEEGQTVKFNRDTEGIDFEFVNMYRGYGYQIYCLEDIEETIQDSTYNYKKLLPDYYNSVVVDMFLRVQNQYESSEDFTLKISGNVNSSRNGIVQSSILEIEQFIGRTNQEKLKYDLNSAISNLKTVPYFQGNILMAKTDFEIVFKREIIISEDYKNFELYMVKQNPQGLNTLLSEAQNRGFFFNSKTVNLNVSDDDGIIYSNRSINISEFKAPGISNSFWSFLPGLGLSRITHNSYQNELGYNWKKLGKTFLISSISLGVVSISSKIYSNLYYNRYRNDLFGSSASSNYQKANVSQKVFVSSLWGYGLLGLLDFSFTFIIGTKNKSIQHDLNKALKDGNIITLK